jgi:hypothetical protein
MATENPIPKLQNTFFSIQNTFFSIQNTPKSCNLQFSILFPVLYNVYLQRLPKHINLNNNIKKENIMLTAYQIREVMKYQLGAFNDEQVDITDNTVHNEVLSDSDGYTNAHSKDLYQGVMIWTFKKNNHTVKDWPDNWMDMSVEDLAEKLS